MQFYNGKDFFDVKRRKDFRCFYYIFQSVCQLEIYYEHYYDSV